MGGKKKGRKFWSMQGTHRATKLPYDSGLEKKFLDQCYMQGIKVVRCTVRVPYKDGDGKWHHYEPDFYLPDFDFVVEIKGSWAFKTNHAHVREKFYAAQTHFKGRYTLITEKELRTDFVAGLHKVLTDGRH